MFFQKIHFRMKILLFVFLFLLFVIFVRVFVIQVFDYQKLSSLANQLWSRDLELEADRGKILDRNGVVLADNLTTASLMIVPNQISNKEEVARSLSNILGVISSYLIIL